VIAGGESGPSARPAHPQWFRDVRDQCERAGVPFFFKQWGEWEPISRTDGYHESPFGDYNVETKLGFSRVGKRKAGALLDGAEWKQFPTTS
jgi:protein gp37